MGRELARIGLRFARGLVDRNLEQARKRPDVSHPKPSSLNPKPACEPACEDTPSKP